jgi:hypothetical protein
MTSLVSTNTFTDEEHASTRLPNPTKGFYVRFFYVVSLSYTNIFLKVCFEIQDSFKKKRGVLSASFS